MRRLGVVLGSCLLVLLAQTHLYSGDIEMSDERILYTSYVEKCMDILMKHGADRHGDVHAPILVSILDVETRTCPLIPEKLDEYFRVTRRDRCSPGGSNHRTDQPSRTAGKAIIQTKLNGARVSFRMKFMQ